MSKTARSDSTQEVCRILEYSPFGVICRVKQGRIAGNDSRSRQYSISCHSAQNYLQRFTSRFQSAWTSEE
ncbi:MAG: hypothetical protein KZQ78_13395, partial [Candidatus Thiodiazotropha sp. (ex Ustalcina ferruginea)]|nr:hypothetical protein [Candidatus Thiodiazotropha sp. (ex Ustalcina ferruginea)]